MTVAGGITLNNNSLKASGLRPNCSYATSSMSRPVLKARKIATPPSRGMGVV